MKKYSGWIKLILFLAICGGVIWFVLRMTAEYPTLGEPVSYEVNDAKGFSLSIEEPAWSFYKGYTLRYDIQIDSEDIYTLSDENGPFERLEREVDGRWYRLETTAEHGFNPMTFDLGGSGAAGFEGSVVQKYAGYGTRLEPGRYRLTVEMMDGQGEPHYLATEFEVE